MKYFEKITVIMHLIIWISLTAMKGDAPWWLWILNSGFMGMMLTRSWLAEGLRKLSFQEGAFSERMKFYNIKNDWDMK